MADLPVEDALPALRAALSARGVAVLAAPPGAGKTTRVPLAMLDWLSAAGVGERGAGGKIVMLEPRRIAARAAAERMAQTLGEPVGRTVGYRMRGEAAVSAATRIEVITEAILTRMIQAQPDLPGVAAVIFDEFHERALAADFGLALCLDLRGALRPDLWLLVMSATLDTGPVAALLGAEVVASAGRAWPVETRHLDAPLAGPDRAAGEAAAVRRALDETGGGVLVFLPGEGEIGRVAARLGTLPGDVVLQRLYGALPAEQQRAALRPLPVGQRKLVLATAIAETSLTIPDIRVVVDAGRARRLRFDPGAGMSRLVTERVTRAEADQRRGRAGRVAPGVCYRLWTRGEEGALAAFPPAEIETADLAGLALDLALWGAKDLPFLTPPPGPALAEARALLRDLGALDAGGRITPEGRALAALPVHPRLGHMLRAGAAAGAGPQAAVLAALIDARDPLRGGGADLAPRLAALALPAAAPPEARGALAAIRVEAARLARLVRGDAGREDGRGRPQEPPAGGPADGGGTGDGGTGDGGTWQVAVRDLAGGVGAASLSPGALLSLAYPDRIALRRPGEAPRYLLSGGKGAALDPGDALAGQRLLVAADLDGDPREARIRRAATVGEGEIRALHAGRIATDRRCTWDPRTRSVAARERVMLGALALEDRAWSGVPADAVTAAMLEGVRTLGLDALPWSDAARRLCARIEFLRGQAVDLPDCSAEGLRATLDDWLGPYLGGLRSADALGRLDLHAALSARLDRAAHQRLDDLAPAVLTAPTGTRLPIDWTDGTPRVAVRLQEMFGTTRHPTVGPARQPVLVELLSPAGRPVQVTADLPGFWARSYADVRRDLRGRYPRHPWPEDPAAADPTRRVKPRGT